MPQKLAHTPNKPNTLVTISIESEKPRSGEIPQVRLECVRWHANDMHHSRSRADALDGHIDRSRGLADDLRGRADVPSVPNKPETANISHGEGAGTYLGPRDAKRGVRETDGVGSHANASTGHGDTPSVQTDTLMPANAPETIRPPQFESKRPNSPADAAMQRSNKPDGCRDRTDVSSMRTDAETAANNSRTVRTARKKAKPPDSPSEATRQHSVEPNVCGNHADRSNSRTDMQSVANEMETPADEAETISICPVESKPPKSPTKGANGCANETDGSSYHPGTLNMRMHAITPADKVGNIRMRQNKQKWPNSPLEGPRQHSDEPNACGNRTDAHSVETATETATYRSKRIRTRQNGEQTQYSPETRENATPKPAYQQRKVSVGDGAVHVPPIAPMCTTSETSSLDELRAETR